MLKQFGFGKEEKLKSRKQIDALFADGKSFSIPPLRLTYRMQPAARLPLVQAAVSVSKKNFRHAVDRNRVKRILREAYRLQKTALKEKAEARQLELFLFILYTGSSLPRFHEISETMERCLRRLVKTMDSSS